MRIGLENPIQLGADYDGFVLPISNDDGDVWEYRAYLIINGGAPVYSEGGWTAIYPASYGHTASLLVDQTILATDSIMFGFDIRWNTALSQSFNQNAGIGDTFSTSVVPVPGAILLGLLGMSAAGLKLRKFA
jgi:hypothetical protein